MKGVLETGLQYYIRTRAQRWLLLAAVLSFAAELIVTHRLCCSRSLSAGLLAGLAGGAAAMSAVYSAWNFRLISALRTVSLIPHSRLQLAGGMLLAQFIAAAVGAGLVMLLGHPDPPTPLAWGSPRGTFEMLFGIAVSCAVLLQAVTGPSRIISGVSLTLAAAVGLRADLLLKPQIFGLPKADVLALAGVILWFLFSAWYVRAWHLAGPTAAWSGGGDRVARPVRVSREAAIESFLVGQPSLKRVCRQQALTWLSYHLAMVALMGVMKLLTVRHTFPVNYSTGIMILLYGPIVGVNVIAGCLARGSRRLWLRSGEARSTLYAIAARLAWRSLALIGAPLFVLALLEIRFLPHADVDMWFPMATCVSLTPSALYLGLLNFQRRLNLSFLVLYLVAAGSLLAGLLVESAQGRRLLWMAPPALLAIGCLLRTLARRRWFGIDWLKFRAERETSPFAVRRA